MYKCSILALTTYYFSIITTKDHCASTTYETFGIFRVLI